MSVMNTAERVGEILYSTIPCNRGFTTCRPLCVSMDFPESNRVFMRNLMSETCLAGLIEMSNVVYIIAAEPLQRTGHYLGVLGVSLGFD